jgi:adenine-specific DNA-methyltransferase
MDLRHPYLTGQLIAYIGSKRALLPFLHGVFAAVAPDAEGKSFLDPFAGTGAVSRLARMMGFAVAANDWEPYAYAINLCHLGIGAGELDGLFADRGGYDAMLAELSSLARPTEGRAYISRHYAPRSTASADWRTERLFYTRENALVLDAVRDRIEDLYPGGWAEPGLLSRQKAALLAPLLYEAATHTNTSGVFKACHRGFGGHGRDALSRILAPVRLERPVLIDSPAPSAVFCREAREFLRGRTADVCYLDPPYAVHQYGSNYFMLNSIALWDKPAVSEDRGPDGRLLRKAGIRADWTRTRSPFCYRESALAAMRETVDAADSRWLVVSYSDEGLIGLEELCDLLAARGALSIRSTGYVKYPGGRQSLTRTIRNRELALVVERGGARAARSARRMLREVQVARAMGGSFDPARIRAAFRVQDDAILVAAGGGSSRLARLPMRHFWRFTEEPPAFLTAAAAAAFVTALAGCAARGAREEIGILVRVAEAEEDQAERRGLEREILRLLNRIAHRKYRLEFEETLAELRAAPRSVARSAVLADGLRRIEERAQRRLAALGASSTSERAGFLPPPLGEHGGYRPRVL